MKENQKYTPIDCNYYDQLEAWSMLKQNLHLEYKDQKGMEQSCDIKIKDLQTNDKVEYLITDQGLVIRLDQMIRLTPIG